MKKITLLSLIAMGVLHAGGYKIPETSTNGVALSAANVAHSTSADAAYYNPANMIFMADENTLEADLMVINLSPTNYKGRVGGIHDGVNIDAESEMFFIPSLNYVSPKLGNARVGVSISVPGGLTKRWNDTPAKDKAEEFTLEAIEINPTVAFEVTPTLAVAVGFRLVHSSGIVKSSGLIARDMNGNSNDVGYNFALSYKPTKNLDLAVTYRSNVNLTQEGTAKLSDTTGTVVYDGGSTVAIPLPATVNVALAYTLPTKTTIEFVYEKTYWSAYHSLDFNYAGNIGNLTPYFDDPIAKNWEDTNAYRLGITQELDGIRIMAGLVLDESPVPDNRVSFELPDSNSLSVSCGARYDVTPKINIGLSALYSMRDDRAVKTYETDGSVAIDGTFSNSNILIFSAGLGYKF